MLHTSSWLSSCQTSFASCLGLSPPSFQIDSTCCLVSSTDSAICIAPVHSPIRLPPSAVALLVAFGQGAYVPSSGNRKAEPFRNGLSRRVTRPTLPYPQRGAAGSTH